MAFQYRSQYGNTCRRLWRSLIFLFGFQGGLAHAYTLEPTNYPQKPVRLIVGSSPGGGADIISRAAAQWLSQRLGQSFVVDNRAGGNGIIGITLLTQAPPDGYTLFGGASLIVTATPMKKVPFDTRKSLSPIVQMTSMPFMVICAPQLPVSNLKEFLILARSRPVAFSYASSGMGSIAHLGTELMKFMAGNLTMTHIPYRGTGQAIFDVMSGQVQLIFASGLGTISHVKNGKLTLLAVTSLKRLPAFADTPTVAETLPGFQIDNMHALYAPAGIPIKISHLINRHVVDYMNQPEVKSKLALEATDVASLNTPEQFQVTFSRQVDLWENFIKSSQFPLKE